MSAAAERSREVERDLALMGELAGRLRNLEQSIERSYGPALRRLLRRTSPVRAPRPMTVPAAFRSVVYDEDERRRRFVLATFTRRANSLEFTATKFMSLYPLCIGRTICAEGNFYGFSADLRERAWDAYLAMQLEEPGAEETMRAPPRADRGRSLAVRQTRWGRGSPRRRMSVRHRHCGERVASSSASGP